MGRCGSHLVGFNLGYGFGNTEKATENMIFVDGKASKLEQVTFQIPGEEEGKPRYLEPGSLLPQTAAELLLLRFWIEALRLQRE